MIWADPSLPHQIVLVFRCGKIAVTCNCMAGDPDRALDVRLRFDDPREPMRIWREHYASV